MIKIVVAAIVASLATLAVAQTVVVPVVSYDPEQSAREAHVFAVDPGDGTICYVLDYRRGSAISCVKQ